MQLMIDDDLNVIVIERERDLLYDVCDFNNIEGNNRKNLRIIPYHCFNLFG